MAPIELSNWPGVLAGWLPYPAPVWTLAHELSVVKPSPLSSCCFILSHTRKSWRGPKAGSNGLGDGPFPMQLRGESRAHSVTMAALAGLRLDMALGVLPGHLMFIHGLFNVEFPSRE
jgi:hypothetical protein